MRVSTWLVEGKPWGVGTWAVERGKDTERAVVHCPAVHASRFASHMNEHANAPRPTSHDALADRRIQATVRCSLLHQAPSSGFRTTFSSRLLPVNRPWDIIGKKGSDGLALEEDSETAGKSNMRRNLIQPLVPAWLFPVHLLAIWVLGNAVLAQPQVGDYILSGHSTGAFVFYVNPAGSGNVTTLVQVGPNVITPQGITMDRENHAMLWLARPASQYHIGQVLRISPGTHTSLVTLLSYSAWPQSVGLSAVAWSREGDLLLTGSHRSVIRFDPGIPGVHTTFYQNATATAMFTHVSAVPLGAPFAVTSQVGSPSVFTLDETGKIGQTLTTLALGSAWSTDFDYGHQQNARLVVCRRSGTTSYLHYLDPANGTLTTLTTVPHPLLPPRYTQRDTFVVASTDGWIQEVDRAGKVIRTMQPTLPTGFFSTGFEIYGNNRLHVNIDRATNPPDILFDLNDRSAANMTYTLGLSFNCRGFPIDKGRRINLTPDTLFMLSVNRMLPSVFVNLTGQLDGLGHARASLRLPKGVPLRGLTLYAAWISFHTSGIYAVSETEHFVLP